MNISRKLFFLVVTILASVIVAIGVFVVILLPLLEVQREQVVLEELEDALSSLTIGILILPGQNQNIGEPMINDRLERADRAFEAVASLERLPTLNVQITEALTIISRLKNLYSQRVGDLLLALERLRNAQDENGILMYNLTLDSLADSYVVERIGKSDEFAVLVSRFETVVETLRGSLESTMDTVTEQEAFIRMETRRILMRGIVVSGSISLVVIALSLTFSLIMARRISKNVVVINEGVDRLESGNLTCKCSVAARDELGHLGRSLNRFTESLADSVRRIGHATDQSREAQQNLSGATEEASAATRQMKANTDSINKQIEILDGSVNDSSQAIAGITSGIEETDRELDSQIAMVEQSSASVSRMIESIQNVTRITERSTEVTDDLTRAAASGGVKLGETNTFISAVGDGIEDVQNITRIIESIASRTNLLAMNAAIEAAHAGDAGRGFAVVAGEIRELAEASAKNSKQITAILSSMVEKIQAADRAGQETNGAFAQLDEKVKQVKEAYDTINSSMRELETGSGEISRAMSELSDASVRVGSSSRKMRDQSGVVGESIRQVQRVSGEVTGGVKEIAVGLDEVNSAMEHLVDLSRRIREIGDRLDNAVSVFQVGDDLESRQAV